ncbi:MAG: condensation domain-containing protein, partial [Acidobacteriota bacterium]|nr:condensation domain-containing protein [Acidobacteriota bacterium]
MPLTPIQGWFFELRLPRPERFNMTLLLTVQPRLETGVLLAAAQAVTEYHDAFRLRFSRLGADAWRQEYAESGAPLCFVEADLSALPPTARAAAITGAAERLDESLDLARGPVLRMASFRLGQGLPGRLLIVVHHLVMDAVSWGILVEDLAAACEQLRGGAAVRLPPRPVSFKRWSQRLSEHARSAALELEAEHWL